MSTLVAIFYLCLFTLAITKFKCALFIFIAHIPIVPLMHIKGTIPFSSYFSIILAAHFLINKKNVDMDNILDRKVVKKYLLYFVIFAAVIFLNGIKFSILRGGHLTSIPSHILTAIIAGLACINYSFIFKLVLKDGHYRNLVSNAIIVSSVILSSSVIFTQQLGAMGMTITEYSLESGRSSGLFAGGDCNSLAGFLCMVISFMLVKTNLTIGKFNIVNAGILLLFAIIILLTASRMGFLIMVGLFVFYFFYQRSSFSVKNIFYLLLIIGILLCFSDTFLAPVLERLNAGTSISDEVASGEEGRSMIWMLYLTYMFSSDANTILIGSDKSIFYLVPHNFFINTFFLNGVIVTLLVIYALIKSITFFASQKQLKHIFPIAAATIISCMFLVDVLMLYYYVLICVLVWSYCRYTEKYFIKY